MCVYVCVCVCVCVRKHYTPETNDILNQLYFNWKKKESILASREIPYDPYRLILSINIDKNSLQKL